MKRSKYGAIKTTVDGITFDSKAEATRWCDLQNLQRGGKITHLARQIHFQIKSNDKLICNYIADFTYVENGNYVVEDVKGIITRDFRLKAKLFKAQYGYPITIYPPKKKKVRVTKLPPAHAIGYRPDLTVKPKKRKGVTHD